MFYLWGCRAIGFCATKVSYMRFSASFPKFLSLLAVPIFAAMLVFPANAETDGAPAATQQRAEATPGAAQEAPPGATETDSQATPAGEPGESSGESGTAEGTPNASPEKPKSSVVINVNKSSQQMTVFVDGVELYSWPVSTGKSHYFTPSGSYTASSMNKIWYSKQWDNAPMPNAIFFTKKGHAIHGTNEVKNLGKPASHGCVRLSPEHARTLYSLVEANGLAQTQVILTGVTPGGELPQVASPQGPPEDYWFPPGYREPPRKRRRGLFGRRWFQPDGPTGYYQPRDRYNYRGIGPRGY
jgi:lipoprotein-anchoring transpeptidase ErfK/SrfK